MLPSGRSRTSKACCRRGARTRAAPARQRGGLADRHVWRRHIFEHGLLAPMVCRLDLDRRWDARPVRRSGTPLDVARQAGRDCEDRGNRNLAPVGRPSRRRSSRGDGDWKSCGSPSPSSRRTARSTCSPTPSGNTRTYSNRFAAHIVRQHQFNALVRTRGLETAPADGRRRYPPAATSCRRWGCRAEYWVEGVGDDYGTDTNETGPPSTSPPTRSASTATAGADRADAAGRRAAAGALRGHARRRPVRRRRQRRQRPELAGRRPGRPLPRLLAATTASATSPPPPRRAATCSSGCCPRLKIADRCTLDRRFLVVRGDLRTYKIHLGSGNILMEPNDQYLCIVPDRGAAAADAEASSCPSRATGRSRSSSARRSCSPTTRRSPTRRSPGRSIQGSRHEIHPRPRPRPFTRAGRSTGQRLTHSRRPPSRPPPMPATPRPRSRWACATSKARPSQRTPIKALKWFRKAARKAMPTPSSSPANGWRTAPVRSRIRWRRTSSSPRPRSRTTRGECPGGIALAAGRRRTPPARSTRSSAPPTPGSRPRSSSSPIVTRPRPRRTSSRPATSTSAAADQNHPAATYRLGKMMMKGEGVTMDAHGGCS